MLSTGREVFDHLTSHGGLDAARYDSDLIAELKRDLGFPQNDDLARSLEQHGTDPADFLAAFFHVVQPFAVMFADLLGMFERAGAKRTDRNLEIAMSFGDPRRDFGFDLDHFRAMLVTLRRVTSVVERVLWGHDHFWMLHHAFTEGESAADMFVTAPAATEWLRVYREDRAWPRSRLGAPQAGDALLDGLLRRVWRVWAAVTDATAELADDRTALRDRQGSEEPVAGAGLWDPGVLARLDLDDWAAGIVQAAYSRTERLHALVEPQRSEEAAVLIGSLEEVMSSGPMVLEEAAHLEKHLTEFLRLPLWQKRHELYSAWVSTQIIDAMEEADPRIHHSDGRLVFSFAGTHFATLERTDPRLHVWAELRSPLAAPIGKGRKAGIQPDYTITREPIHGAGSAAVVVECKQYGKASPGNFSDALTDYARGRPNAHIVLVNYGPAPVGILDRVDAALRTRTTLIGEFRPRSQAALDEFRLLLREQLAGFIARPRQVAPPAPAGELVLTWEDAGSDLDLHLSIQGADGGCRIWFFEPGGDGTPWGALLEGDVLHGGGAERIRIARWLEADYRCLVNRFSGGVPLARTGAEVRVRVGDMEATVECPSEGNGEWWEVLAVDGATRQVRVTNRFVEPPPGWGTGDEAW